MGLDFENGTSTCGILGAVEKGKIEGMARGNLRTSGRIIHALDGTVSELMHKNELKLVHQVVEGSCAVKDFRDGAAVPFE